VVIANVNADDKRELASKYSVTGYPTLILFSPEHPEGERYSGARELDDLVSYVNDMAGTQRTAAGLLNGDAGRVAELDSLVAEFQAATAEEDEQGKQATLERVRTLVAGLEDRAQQWSAKVYQRALAQVQKAADYVQRETARLQKMIDSGSVSTQKIDEFKKRINILDSF
jgi:protein disulfide-isomerase A6